MKQVVVGMIRNSPILVTFKAENQNDQVWREWHGGMKTKLGPVLSSLFW